MIYDVLYNEPNGEEVPMSIGFFVNADLDTTCVVRLEHSEYREADLYFSGIALFNPNDPVEDFNPLVGQKLALHRALLDFDFDTDGTEVELTKDAKRQIWNAYFKRTFGEF